MPDGLKKKEMALVKTVMLKIRIMPDGLKRQKWHLLKWSLKKQSNNELL